MRTNEVAKKVKVHPNTVRLYEDWGFISSVPREANTYRRYSNIHLIQMQIARYAFRQEFIQNNLRKQATRIVRLSGSELFSEALIEANKYLQFLEAEYSYTCRAVQIVEKILTKVVVHTETYTHKEVANNLQLTEETLRNWERNGLFTVKRNSQNRRQYSERDIQKLLIIRTLRTAYFSIAAIHHLIEGIEEVQTARDIQSLLNSPKFADEFLHVTDELEINLKNAMKDVKSIIALLEDL